MMMNTLYSKKYSIVYIALGKKGKVTCQISLKLLSNIEVDWSIEDTVLNQNWSVFLYFNAFLNTRSAVSECVIVVQHRITERHKFIISHFSLVKTVSKASVTAVCCGRDKVRYSFREAKFRCPVTCEKKSVS